MVAVVNGQKLILYYGQVVLVVHLRSMILKHRSFLKDAPRAALLGLEIVISHRNLIGLRKEVGLEKVTVACQSRFRDWLRCY